MVNNLGLIETLYGVVWGWSMACRGPVPIIISEHLAGRKKSGRRPDQAPGPCLARGCHRAYCLCLIDTEAVSVWVCALVDQQISEYSSKGLYLVLPLGCLL